MFLNALKKLLHDIKIALSSYDSNNTKTDMIDGLQLRTELNNLKDHLEDMDFDMVNQSVNNLLKLAQSEDEKNTVRNISQLILLFDYDEAIKVIEKY